MRDEEKSHTFVGREKEIALFKQWLIASQEEGKWILYLHDAQEAVEKKGGVGKTWLLRQYAMLARQLYPDIVVVSIDFFNIAEREGVVIADRVVDALQEAYPSWNPDTFHALLYEYREALRGGKEDVTEVRTRLADALTVNLHTLDEQLQGEHKQLLLLFDTYEQVEQNPIITVLRLPQTFPDNYHFERIGVVVAGRNALDWEQANWRGREHEVQTIALSPFTPEEMLQYLNQLYDISISQPEKAEKLYERTEGRPILVGLVSDVLRHTSITLDQLISPPKVDFEASLVMKINQLEQPIDTVILLMAHVYHRFHFNLLNWIVRASQTDLLQHTNQEVLMEQLLSLSFVRKPGSGDEFVLHDEMGPLVVKYCWNAQDPTQRMRKDLSRYVVDYYTQELANVQLEQLRQAYSVEQLYHQFYINPDEGYKEFEHHFKQAINLWLSAFARSLLQVAQGFAPDMSPRQQHQLKLFEAQLLQKEENAERALAILNELEQEADQQWLKEREEDILYAKALSYLQHSNFPRAIDCFSTAKEITKEQRHMISYAAYLNWIGYTYYRQGQLDTALRYYEEAVEIYERLNNRRSYANVLNSIGNVYRQQGRVEEALRRCKIGWRIRRDLSKAGKVSEVYVAWSLSAIGTVYLHIDDLAQAKRYFQEALDIFARIGYKQGLATTYNRFGQVEMASGNMQNAMQWFQKAYYMALGIDTESQINSLNKQGWIHAQEKHWEEAVTLLHQAVELARKVHDVYQEAESLLDLSEVLGRMDQQEQSQQALKEAETIAQTYQYNYLLGLAHESQGDLKYSAGDYEASFQCYTEACRYMAYYNRIKYNKTLRKVIDTLLETPDTNLSPIINSVIKRWKDLGLEKDFPELISSCEEVRFLMRS